MKPHGNYLRGLSTAASHRIVKATSQLTGVPVADIMGRSRCQRFVRPRFVAWAVCREYLELSYPEIGRVFDRDHTSVISGVQTFYDHAEDDDFRDLDTIAKMAGVYVEAA